MRCLSVGIIGERDWAEGLGEANSNPPSHLHSRLFSAIRSQHVSGGHFTSEHHSSCSPNHLPYQSKSQRRREGNANRPFLIALSANGLGYCSLDIVNFEPAIFSPYVASYLAHPSHPIAVFRLVQSRLTLLLIVLALSPIPVAPVITAGAHSSPL